MSRSSPSLFATLIISSVLSDPNTSSSAAAELEVRLGYFIDSNQPLI
jgi:hypothetical protein